MISNLHEATKEVCKSLGKSPRKAQEINDGRYKVIYFQDEIVGILFKRKPFMTFQEHTIGESINKEDLQYMIDIGVRRIFNVYSDDKIYVISPYTIIAQGTKRTTEAEGKETISYPIKALIRL